ncbi:hypothetical protein COU62_02595 [Candidatus Pacearchaeota archaeon CG10_big_fil_rev_8_21_14_0_10_35_219]|nr:hypothetical protein [Candidatus Pacearchaeota archaeon]OIO43341.1 MAG: hypothetical protein AUJ63_00410 [Candidatus Pacearchaeota archaeon CG1_02_35_32]PIO07729.1 MAG: hypothetical protein COU62_02595 [Candidatus Pacearchaeota archaeon CG10_big_fil_rev_8_21_14_0_10_35_219]PIY81489.1 MAG: hypothetical protein COY79_01990 [Candidatus Pacearchaeota archaeon CG_4_10_14_0_8_um_filter_35_169]PIZ80425.1 MAG: hypothetical protein COY00_01130 [Candidatus Pacearchaeota archaeon CG_4_10_14_0_2_um_filt
MDNIKKLIKLVLTVFLTVDLIFLVLIFSILSAVDFNVEKKINEVMGNGIDNLSEGYYSYIDDGQRVLGDECSKIDVESFAGDLGEYGQFEINCSDVGDNLKEVAEIRIKEKAKNKLEESGANLQKINDGLITAMSLLAIVAAASILGLIFVGKMSFLIYTGISFIISGSFFFISFIVNSEIRNNFVSAFPAGLGFEDLPAVDGFINEIAWMVLRNYLIILTIGLILFGFGVGLRLGRGKK